MTSSMALFQALTAFTQLPRGFRNPELRPYVAALLGRPYSAAQMTYDLRRLRLKGLIHRIARTHRYTATSYGLKVAFFSSKLYLRLLRPHLAGAARRGGLPAATPPHRSGTTRDRDPETASGGCTCRLRNLLHP